MDGAGGGGGAVRQTGTCHLPPAVCCCLLLPLPHHFLLFLLHLHSIPILPYSLPIPHPSGSGGAVFLEWGCVLPVFLACLLLSATPTTLSPHSLSLSPSLLCLPLQHSSSTKWHLLLAAVSLLEWFWPGMLPLEHASACGLSAYLRGKATVRAVRAVSCTISPTYYYYFPAVHQCGGGGTVADGTCAHFFFAFFTTRTHALPPLPPPPLLFHCAKLTANLPPPLPPALSRRHRAHFLFLPLALYSFLSPSL